MSDLSRLAAAEPVTLTDNTTQVTLTGTSLNVNVTNVYSSTTNATVAQNASSVTLVSALSTRKGLMFYNEATVPLYVRYGSTASLSDFSFIIQSGGYWEMPEPVYTGVINGIWTSAGGGAVHITYWNS